MFGLPLLYRVHGVNSALVEVVLSNLNLCELCDPFFRSTLHCHLDGQLRSRYLTVNRALSFRVGGIVSRDESNVEGASAAVVLLVVDIGLVVDIVAPVAAHALL